MKIITILIFLILINDFTNYGIIIFMYMSLYIHTLYIHNILLQKIKEIHNISKIDYNMNEIERQSKVIRKLYNDKHDLYNEIKNLEFKYNNIKKLTRSYSNSNITLISLNSQSL